VEKYDIFEGGKMVDNYHIKHGMNKLRRKFGKNLLNQTILIRRKIKRLNITKLLKILKNKFDHIDNVDDMEHNVKPFSPPHGKMFQMNLIELAKGSI
jgi:hypothetical protein